MEGNAGCIDLRALERLRTLGGGELLTNMVHLFISHAEPVLRDAEIALGRGDLEGVRRAAHSLKSSAANLGAYQVQNLAGTIEDLAEHGRIEEVQPLMAELQKAYLMAKASLLAPPGKEDLFENPDC